MANCKPSVESYHTVLADNSGVVIAHVDCTAADNTNRPLCDAQGVNGFPTLHIYKDGVKVRIARIGHRIFLSIPTIPRRKNTMAREILQNWRSL